jgi:hypothetical protein
VTAFAGMTEIEAGAVVVPFYDVWDGENFRGFDAVARVIANGKMVGEPIPVAQWVRRSIDAGTPDAALSAKFPAAAPRLYRDPKGRLWLDLLETLIPEDGPKLIVYQRVDLTESPADQPNSVSQPIPGR